MPVTIKPAIHPARERKATNAVGSVEALLKKACPEEYKKCKSIIQSSFPKFNSESPLYASTNGFVRAAIDAYCYHHHLTLRPEDIWFSILTQLSLYINANAEELRSLFVAHQGQKELVVYGFGNIHTVDFGKMAQQFTDLMNKNVVDPDLQPWIMPAFSTTTETDKTVAAVIMMGAMQKYFSYTCCLLCGIPSVTLLGVRADWQLILERLEKLPSLGGEATQFYKLLKPVLTRFVACFDDPDSAETKDFWQKIADVSGGSGPPYVSGWITAFCFWNEDGKSLYTGFGGGSRLDATLYHQVDMDDIPAGYSSVPVNLDDNGTLYETIMVAGSVGIRVSSTNEPLDGGPYPPRSMIYSATGLIPNPDYPPPANAEPGLDTLQPESGWFMFEKMGEKGNEDDKGGQIESSSDKSLEKLATMLPIESKKLVSGS
ncbi:MAG: hypothetical protein MMC33_005639 [Icmadophila ericetorum]|nr:hypothetical protein [Icmadophila ericetorum]